MQESHNPSHIEKLYVCLKLTLFFQSFTQNYLWLKYIIVYCVFMAHAILQWGSAKWGFCTNPKLYMMGHRLILMQQQVLQAK